MVGLFSWAVAVIEIKTAASSEAKCLLITSGPLLQLAGTQHAATIDSESETLL